MATASQQLEDLRRSLDRLRSLDGRVLHTHEGPALVRVRKIVNASLLARALVRDGVVRYGTLCDALELAGPPVLLDRAAIARLHHDLRRARAVPKLHRVVREHRRYFSRFQQVDAAWLSAREKLLAEVTRPKSRGPGDPVLDLLIMLRGREWAEDWSAARKRAMALRERSRPRQRMRWLVDNAETSTTPLLAELRKVIPFRRRAHRRRAVELVYRYLFSAPRTEEVPLIPVRHEDGTNASFREIVERIASALVHDRAASHHVVSTRELDEHLLELGLAIRLDAKVGWSQLNALLAHRKRLRREAAGLRLSEAIALLKLEAANKKSAKLALTAKALRSGLALETVRLLARHDRLNAFTYFEDSPDELRAYLAWTVPLLERLGEHAKPFLVAPGRFSDLFEAKRGRTMDPTLLLHCLIDHPGLGPKSFSVEFDRFEAALSLMRHVPSRAAKIRKALSGGLPELAKTQHREFTNWVGDPALVGRYLFLRKQLDDCTTLSKAIRQDFERAARLSREVEFLARVPDPTKEQRERLAVVDLSEENSPERTVSRLRRRIGELQSEVFKRELTASLRAMARSFLGRPIPHWNARWQDAIRFMLGCDDNRELLRQLLCFAADRPTAEIERTRKENRAWLDSAKARFDVEVWLSGTQRELTTKSGTFKIGLERRPIEVLRMGIPFETCLSLIDGCNAASTVINALDANKQVIYVRDARGKIIARKLIGITKDWKVVGYCNYCSLKGDEREDLVRRMNRFAARLAKALGLLLTRSGEPEQLHKGFWYDDGPVSFADGVVSETSGVGKFCASFGLPTPETPTEWLQDTALLARKCEAGEVRAVDLPREASPLHNRALRQLAEGKTIEALVDLLSEEEMLRPCQVEWLVDAFGLTTTLRALLPWMKLWVVRRGVIGYFGGRTASADLVMPMLTLAEQTARSSRRIHDDGIVHGLMTTVHHHAAHYAPGALLGIADRLDAVFARVVASNEGCAQCRSTAVAQLGAALEAAYRRQPDPGAILRALRGRVRSELGVTLALHIARNFTISKHASSTAPALVPSVRTVLKVVRARHPALAESDAFTIAWARHSNALHLHGREQRPTFEVLCGAPIVAAPETLDAMRRDRGFESALRSRAKNRGAFTNDLIDNLVKFGFHEILSDNYRALTERPVGGERQIKPARLAEAIRAARWVGGSVVEDPVELETLRPWLDRCRRPEDAFDGRLLDSAHQRALRGEDLAHQLAILECGLPTERWHRAFCTIAASKDHSSILLDAARSIIAKARPSQIAPTTTLFRSIWRLTPLRAALAQKIAKLDADEMMNAFRRATNAFRLIDRIQLLHLLLSARFQKPAGSRHLGFRSNAEIKLLIVAARGLPADRWLNVVTAVHCDQIRARMIVEQRPIIAKKAGEYRAALKDWSGETDLKAWALACLPDAPAKGSD